MKKMIALLLIVICFSVWAADTDNFSITVTINYIDISLKESSSHSTDYATWALDNVSAGAVSEMTSGDHIWVDNQSNIDLDFYAYSESAAPAGCGYGTPTAWVPTGPGANAYKLELAQGDATTPGTYTTIDGTDTGSADLFYNATAGETFDLYGKLSAPTTADDGCQHTVNVTITAIVP